MPDVTVKRSLGILLATVAGVALTVSLGLWQLRRADQKQQLHDQLMARQQLPALANADLPCDSFHWHAQEQRLARVSGHWLHAHTVVLDNRVMQGQAGFVVLTPLLLAPAPTATGCARRVLLVQRGWLPRDPMDRTHVPRIAKPEGLVVVPVRLTFAPSKMLSLQGSPSREGGTLRQNVDLDELATEWKQPLLPGSAQQTSPEQPSDGVSSGEQPTLQRQWWQPEADVMKHQAYAAQWFLMALTMLGLYGWFQWWRPYKNLKHEH